MAYRKFYNHEEPGVTDYSPIERGIANLFSGVNEVYNKRQKKADQYGYALEYGNFENDNKFNEEYVKSVLTQGRNEIRKTGTVSSDLLSKEEQGKRYAADQKAQYTRFTNLDKAIKEKAVEDPYYDPSIDKKHLSVAAFGEDGERNFTTRGQALQEAEKTIGSDPLSFRIDEYTAKWIDQQGKKSKGASNDGTGYSYSSPFVDPKTGKPGVTNEHAINFLESRPETMTRMQYEVDKDLIKDVEAIKQLASNNDKRASWAKDLSDEEILLGIKADAKKNPFNKVPYKDQVVEKTKARLKQAADISENVTVGTKKTNEGGEGVTNDNIGHSSTFQNNGVNVSTPGGLGPQNPNAPRNVAGPGGILMIKKGVTAGRPIVIEAGSKNAFSYNTGKNSTRTGASKYNLTGYQLAPYTTDGKLIPIQADNIDELKKKIAEMPLDQLKNMAPSMSVALQGYTLDEGKALSEVETKSLELSKKLGDAIYDGDAQTERLLRQQIDQLAKLRSSFGSSELSDGDIANLAAQAGIKSIRNDQLLKADPADLDKVKTITGGLDLKKEDGWSDEMREVNDIYKKRWQEANSTAPATEKKVKAKMVTVTLPDGRQGQIPDSAVDQFMKDNPGSTRQ